MKPWKTSRLRGAKISIVGCGDVGERLLALLSNSPQAQLGCIAVGRRRPDVPVIADKPSNHRRFISADLDDRHSLKRIPKLAPWLVYLAPPPATGTLDSRMKHFLAAALTVPKRAQRCVYVSTTGVYGAAQGAWVTETSPLKPTELRGLRRIDAENRLKQSNISTVIILRAPGIYARERLPIDRIQKGLPAFIAAHDVPTNHIHAHDLARLCWLGLFRGRNRRSYNAADGLPMMHADYLSAVAHTLGLQAPPRLPREQVQAALSPVAWSMLAGARRVSSERLHSEWGVRLRYPSMTAFLQGLRAP